MASDDFLSFYLTYSLLLALGLFYVIFYYKKRKFLKFASNHSLFYVPVLPIIGTAYLFAFVGEKGNFISLCKEGEKKFGGSYNVWLGHNYLYITNKPEEIKTVLNNSQSLDKPPLYAKLNCLFHDGLLIANTQHWKPRRKLFQHAYKPNVIKNNTPSYYAQSCQLVENIKSLKKTDDLFLFFNMYIAKNFFLTACGISDDEFESMRNVFLSNLKVQEYITEIFLYPFIPLKLWLKFFPTGRKMWKAIQDLRTALSDLVLKRKQHIIDVYEDDTVNIVDLGLKGYQDDLFGLFGELIMFSAAATDTTGINLTFCMILLAMHPDIQETLYKEIKDILGDGEILYDDLPKLKYLDAVISEALRLFPSVPIIIRYANSDLNFGKTTFPKGGSIGMSFFNLHRNPEYWPEPKKFDPSRFFPENLSKIKPYTYLPFSGGPRDCIGRRVALMSLKVTVANVIRHYRLTSAHKSIDEFHVTSTLTMGITHPVDCQFIPRENL